MSRIKDFIRIFKDVKAKYFAEKYSAKKKIERVEAYAKAFHKLWKWFDYNLDYLIGFADIFRRNTSIGRDILNVENALYTRYYVNDSYSGNDVTSNYDIELKPKPPLCKQVGQISVHANQVLEWMKELYKSRKYANVENEFENFMEYINLYWDQDRLDFGPLIESINNQI